MDLSRKKQLMINIFAGGVLLFILLRWFILIDRYSVNMLFWDQWDFMGGLFEGNGLWKLFSWQHGPHRQGAGFFLTKIVAELSGWNTRVECFLIGTIICLAALIALLLKWRLTGSVTSLDIIIPLLYLSPLHFELFANTPNISHGAMPLLLITLFCLCWTVRNIMLRYSLCAVVNFMTIYTGFGLFIGCVTPLLFLSEFALAFRMKNRRRAAAALFFLSLSAASFLSFFINYTFNSAVECFVFPHPHPLIYLKFILVSIASYCGIRISYEASVLIAAPIFAFMLYAIILSASDVSYNIYRKTEINIPKQIIFFLAVFSMIFLVNLAVGRACLGLGAATASRYTPYITPAFFAAYLFLVTKEKVPVKQIAICAGIFFLTTFSIGNHNKIYADGLALKKKRWKEAYLKTENIYLSNTESGFSIHPNPQATKLKEKLEYLKKNRLNLYLEGENSAGNQ